MATLKSDIYKVQNLDVLTKADMGDFIGRVRQLFINFTLAAELGATDIVKLCIIPPGARVINYHLNIPDLGTTGAGTIGWAASVDGVEAADATGFAASTSFTTAADLKLASAATGFCKRFASAVDVQIAMSAATDVGNGLSIKGYFEYVID